MDAHALLQADAAVAAAVQEEEEVAGAYPSAPMLLHSNASLPTPSPMPATPQPSALPSELFANISAPFVESGPQTPLLDLLAESDLTDLDFSSISLDECE